MLRTLLTGNLTNDAVRKEKDGKEYYYATVAVNINKNDIRFYTCFFYGVSADRAALMTKGSLIEIIGAPDERIVENPTAKVMEISRTMNVREFDILISKK